MKWNFNINEAPRDRLVVTASKCGKIILSRWIEEGLRWNMYTADHPPLAWHECLEHPNAQITALDLENMF